MGSSDTAAAWVRKYVEDIQMEMIQCPTLFALPRFGTRRVEWIVGRAFGSVLHLYALTGLRSE
jgi:hypothetical protein